MIEEVVLRAHTDENFITMANELIKKNYRARFQSAPLPSTNGQSQPNK